MSVFTPTLTSNPLLPPLPEFLVDLLYPGQVEANKTQRDIDELETELAAISQETAEPGVQPITIKSPSWMEGKEELKKIVAHRPGYRPELSVRYIRDKSRDVPEAEEPKGHVSYVLNEIPESEIPEPKIPESEMPRIGTLRID